MEGAWNPGAALARRSAGGDGGCRARGGWLQLTSAKSAFVVARAPSRGLIVIGVLIFSVFIAPAIYGFVAFHGDYAKMAKPRVLRHVACNCVANLLVMMGSLDLAGRFDQRLSNIVRRTAIVHGGLAFFMLIARPYYSIPMLLAGAPLSAIGGFTVTVLRQSASTPRVGIIGPWHWIAEDRGLRCRRIEASTASIADYTLILVTFEGPLPAEWTPLLSRALLAGKTVRHVIEYLEEARGVVSIEHFELDHLPATGLASYRTPKRLLDLLFVAAALPVAIPITILAAAGVWATMGWPVFFVQDRVGLGGAPFRMLKLRTMRRLKHGELVAAAARGDSRITPLGYWLRRFRIDELPQLANVMVGDMSVIGPRPEQPALAEAYIRDVPAFAFRQLVRPGITGWAQVRTGYAADLQETRAKLAYDLFYLKNFTLGLDLQILARTVWTLLSGNGVR